MRNASVSSNTLVGFIALKNVSACSKRVPVFSKDIAFAIKSANREKKQLGIDLVVSCFMNIHLINMLTFSGTTSICVEIHLSVKIDFFGY